jgi:hypothetical protein
MKFHEAQSSRKAFFRRSEDRRKRLEGLIELFQSHQIPVKQFRHLTATLKAEHRLDCRESGMPVEPQFH